MVKCLICNQEFSFLNWKHLLYSHQITTMQYKSTFGEVKFMSDIIRMKKAKKQSMAAKDWWNTATDEQKKSRSENLSIGMKGIKNRLGYKLTDEEKQLRRSYKHTDAAKYKISQRTILMNQNMNLLKPTKPEREMLLILKNISVHFIQQKRIKNFVVDFFLPDQNTVIEVDGKYWHNYPHLTEKDLMRNQLLKEAGYKVLRFWENEFDETIVVNAINSLGLNKIIFPRNKRL